MNNQDGRAEHIWILLLSAAAIIGSFALQPTPEGHLVLAPDFVGLQLQIPETCASRRILGISCPGCGLTRSFVFTARGQLQKAAAVNAMGPILFFLCCLQIPYRIARYLGWGRQYRKHLAVRSVQAVVTWGIAGGLILTWLIAVISG